MKQRVPVMGLLLCSLFSSTAHGHSGGLDSKGGHFNRKTGEYHYHRQPPPPPAPAVSAPAAAASSVPISPLNLPATMVEVIQRLGYCRSIEDSLRRLSCFESLTDALNSQQRK